MKIRRKISKKVKPKLKILPYAVIKHGLKEPGIKITLKMINDIEIHITKQLEGVFKPCFLI
jgi:hypothetical protein